VSFAVIVLGAVCTLAALQSLSTRAPTRHTEPVSDTDAPPVTLFVPCCGAEEGLAANLRALASQDYPRFRIRYVVESLDDGAVPIIEEVGGAIIVAGGAAGRGQKVHNLLAAIDAAATEPSDVWAFADSDGRPERDWLRRLVAALAPPDVGVASTYRFYVPEPSSFATLVRSVWNASVLSLLGEHERNFAWGGGMAIRRDVFERIGVREAWSGALSDDYALTHAVRRAGLTVRFVPDALVPSHGSIGFVELLSWVSRQIKITRVYWPRLFWMAAVHHAIYATFLVLGPWAGGGIGLGLWGAVLVMGAWTGARRARRYRWVDRHRWAFATLFPLASFVTLQGVVRALASRRVTWRGRVYEMRSPAETVIIR
jgi:cellulose synthase/poly-beta-1,6-N-acetylglucosamine synthase-like glycosyltransferase